MSSQTSGSTSADTGNQADWVWLGASGPHAQITVVRKLCFITCWLTCVSCIEGYFSQRLFFPKPWSKIFQRHTVIVTLMLIICWCWRLFRMLWIIWRLCCLSVLQQHKTHLHVFYVKRITYRGTQRERERQMGLWSPIYLWSNWC